MRVIRTESTKDNLCNYCQHKIATCNKALHIKFGDGVGNDNVIECVEFDCSGLMSKYPIDFTKKFAVRFDPNNPENSQHNEVHHTEQQESPE